MIGIIGAMQNEVAELKEKMEQAKIINKAGFEFYQGILNGRETVVVQAGVGKVNAARCTQCLIDLFDVECVINTGIAGSLQAKINIGDVVLCTDAVQHDMQAEAFGYPVGQIPGMKQFSFEADEKLRACAKTSCEKVNPDIHVHEGRILTGDEFVAGKEKKNWLVETFDGCCTEMEGAAIAQVAALNEVPFLIVRAISDKADDSAHEDYPTFEAKAIERSVRLMYEMAGQL